MASRIDLASKLRPAKKTPAGHLRVDAALTRTGVFVYREPDGTERREYRPESEVFDAESLASFELVPVTNDHPPVMINAENAREYTVGSTGETVRQDGDHVVAAIVVMDATAIAAVEAGKVQVSNGYTCDIDETPGVAPDGTHYDAVQRNIRGNHVAIVDVGRAGPTARIRMDAAIMIEGTKMTLEEMQKKLDAITAENAALKTKLDAFPPKKKGEEDDEEDDSEESDKKKIPAFIKKKMDVLEAKLDAITAERDALKAARTDAAALAARVKERVALETVARSVFDADDATKLSEMTDNDVMIAVVKRVDGDIAAAKCAGKSADYVRARYEGAVERADGASVALGELRSGIEASRNDAGKIDADLDEDAARRAMNERSMRAVDNSKKKA